MEYSIDGLQVNMTALNETMSQVSRHYHTKSFVQYAYWLIALLQVSVSVYLSVCLSIPCGCLFRATIPKCCIMSAVTDKAAPTYILCKLTIIILR